MAARSLGFHWWNVNLSLTALTAALWVTGVGRSVGDSDSSDWYVVLWLSLFMSGWWVVDRFFHAILHAEGETPRDGAIWIVPLSVMAPTMLLFHVLRDDWTRTGAMSLGVFASFVAVTALRPEVDKGRYQYSLGRNAGFTGFLRSLCRYDMANLILRETASVQVPPPEGSSSDGSTPRGSISTGLYYLAALGTAWAAMVLAGELYTRSAEDLRDWASWIVTAFATILGGAGALFAFGLQHTSRYSPDWDIQKGERMVLAILYGIASFFIVGEMFFWSVRLLIEKL